MKNKIKKYMKNISQRDLAKKIGIDESTLSRYINGSRTPKADIFMKIAKVLNVKAEDLMEDR